MESSPSSEITAPSLKRPRPVSCIVSLESLAPVKAKRSKRSRAASGAVWSTVGPLALPDSSSTSSNSFPSSPLLLLLLLPHLRPRRLRFRRPRPRPPRRNPTSSEERRPEETRAETETAEAAGGRGGGRRWRRAAVQPLRCAEDAAVESGAPGVEDALQRLRRPVQVGPASARVPAGLQPHLPQRRPFQQPPQSSRDAPPEGGRGEAAPLHLLLLLLRHRRRRRRLGRAVSLLLRVEPSRTGPEQFSCTFCPAQP